jgi:hypothetical protein
MKSRFSGIVAIVTGLALMAPAYPQNPAGAPSQPQTQPPDNSSTFTLKVNSDLVLTNIVVRDKKTGEVVKGLTEKDFTVTEDGKPQHIASFDFRERRPGRRPRRGHHQRQLAQRRLRRENRNSNPGKSCATTGSS